MFQSPLNGEEYHTEITRAACPHYGAFTRPKLSGRRAALKDTSRGDFRPEHTGSVHAYLRFALNRYSTPTEIAKLTSNWVILVP